MEPKKTARMYTARAAEDQILRNTIRQLVEENKGLRTELFEIKCKEMALRDRILHHVRREFDTIEEPGILSRRDEATQTEPVSASD